nr:hypothetical protein [Tanacetum cinerariifolium]
MLALRSAGARHSAILGKSHGIKNLPGSPNFSAENPPSKHLVFEEPGLNRQDPDKLVVGKPGVDRQILIVWHRRKTRWSDLIRHHWRTITDISLVEIYCGGLRYKFLNVITIIVAIDGWTIS